MCVGNAPAQREQVAVIGTGIAGMTTAYALAEKYDVTVYETATSPGMDAHSLSLTPAATDTSKGPRVDVPIRSFSPHYYPNLLALYSKIGLDLQCVNYCTSLYQLGGPTQFQWVNLNFGKYTVPFTNPFKTWRFLSQFLSFQMRCWRWCGDASLKDITFDEFMKAAWVGEAFYEDFILPVCSVTLSCTTETVKQYPADIVVAFFGKERTTLFTSWLRVRDGACTICEKLLSAIPTERRLYGAKVTEVKPTTDNKVTVSTTTSSLQYDKVVIATEAMYALGMLGDATPAETDILGKFQYEKSCAFVHRDDALMPATRSHWRTMNLILPPVEGYNERAMKEENLNKSCVNVWMNNLVDVPQSMGNVFQTWNPIVEPKDDLILVKANFQRAIHTVESAHTIERLPEIQGQRGIYFCGSYASRGMTLLEQSVISSLNVADALGVTPFWDIKSPPKATFKLEEEEEDSFASKTPFVLGLALLTLPALYYYGAKRQ